MSMEKGLRMTVMFFPLAAFDKDPGSLDDHLLAATSSLWQGVR